MSNELRATAKEILQGELVELFEGGGEIRKTFPPSWKRLAAAYLAEHPADAPNWYSTAEISHWLRGNNYHPEIAAELAELIATNYQLAFNKGFAMGRCTDRTTKETVVAGGSVHRTSCEITAECDGIKDMLLQRNAAYGNSALDPVRIFSRADNAEQLRVRIDDKLSRLARGTAAGEDVVFDLIGYLVLLRIAERMQR